MPTQKDITILQGKTFKDVIRWGTEPIVRKAISGIDLSTGCPRLAVVGHGLPQGWPIAVFNVLAPREINCENNPPRDDDFTPATVIDADHVELNRVSAVGWKAYTSGGFIQFDTPHDIAGYLFRMKIRSKVGGPILASSEAADSPLDIITFSIDVANKAITRLISAADTAALTFKSGVYDLEAESPTGEVFLLCFGSVAVTREVTRS